MGTCFRCSVLNTREHHLCIRIRDPPRLHTQWPIPVVLGVRGSGCRVVVCEPLPNADHATIE